MYAFKVYFTGNRNREFTNRSRLLEINYKIDFDLSFSGAQTLNQFYTRARILFFLLSNSS